MLLATLIGKIDPRRWTTAPSMTPTDIPANYSVYGKAFSVFGRELDMITQDSLRFYKDHAVYQNFGGVVLDREEGRRIAECLGDGKAVILQNHGLLTVRLTRMQYYLIP
jgi:ribulose-5-phosphate 4-epimerase/fuculose-1-phosphate aldolase